MIDREIFGIPIELEPGKPLTSVFHRLSSVLPESQELFTIGPEVSAAEALHEMRKRGYSQVPILHNGEVLGVFSFRSFSHGVIATDRRSDPAMLSVMEFSERVPFARLNDEFQRVISILDMHDTVLVGEESNLQAIVTAVDVLRYLYEVASPYVLAAESELAIRTLIGQCVDAEGLELCANISLNQFYEVTKLPTTVETMTVNDYVQIVGDGRNWVRFEAKFGGTRQSTRSKLERIRDLRNDLYHFKKNMTSDDYDELSVLRDWLLLRVRLCQAKGGR